jgi:hypothetical protein
MSSELMWPYIKSHANPTVEGYLAWAKEQKDQLYQIKYEQVKKNNFFYFIQLYYYCIINIFYTNFLNRYLYIYKQLLTLE